MTHRSRRAVLAAFGVGVASLAGCSSLPWRDDPERIDDVAALADVAELGHPWIPLRSPAPVAPAHLDDRRAAVREELDAVPAEIPESAIPNGVVRAEVAEARTRAVESLAEAGSAATPFERLRTLRSALGAAAEARGGYRAVTDGLTMDAVLAERPEVRADLRAFREDRRVVGGADGATVVLQATVEDSLDAVDRRLARAHQQPHDEGRALAVGGAVDAVTDARTSLADARHLYEQFRANRETRPVGDAFERAADALLADVRRRHDALPDDSFTENPARHLDVTGGLGEPARELVVRAFREAAWRNDPEDAGGAGTANRLLAAHRADHALRAFDRVVAAVEVGTHDGPLSAGTVRAAKLDALEAAERVRSDPAHPWLTNVAARRVTFALRVGDRYLAELADGYGDPAERAAEVYATYVRAGVLARTLPPTNARVLGAVGAAATRERTE